MQDYMRGRDAENSFKTESERNDRVPTASNYYNEKYMFEGPKGLKQDYNNMYKALELKTIERLNQMEQQKYDMVNEVQYYKSENLRFQQQFDKVLNDNKVLYLRVKELEKQMKDSNPSFRNQYQSIIQENEELRLQNNQLLNGQPISPTEPIGIRSSNRLEALQREVEDLKYENYDLKLRLQAQIQDKGIPFSRAQITQTPSKPLLPMQYSSPRNVPRIPDNYCDQIISSNEQHNRAVLERCKSIITAHNYY